MLTTSEIIDLYDQNEYGIIIGNLNILDKRPVGIFLHAIKNKNMELITHILFTTSYFNMYVRHLIFDSIDYALFETILKNNLEKFLDKCRNNDIYYKFNLYDIPQKNNIPLLNIVIKYLATDNLITKLIISTLNNNNLQMIDIFAEANFDIKSVFDTYIIELGKSYEPGDYFNIEYETCDYIQKYGVDIFSHINTLLNLFVMNGNIPGVNYCINMGVDTTNIIGYLPKYPSLNVAKCLMPYCTDINYLTTEMISNIITTDDELDLITYLVDNGLNLDIHIRELMLITINDDFPDTMEYFIKLGYDIHYDDEFLLFYSVYMSHIWCVRILLANGADIHARNNSILSYSKQNIPEHLLVDNKPRYDNRTIIDKILIEAGAYVPNYKPIFCRCIKNRTINRDFLTLLLEFNIDLNSRFDDEIIITDLYIFEILVDTAHLDIIKLCISYGANPQINNHSALRLAIIFNRLNVIKFLLDIGLVLDPESEYAVKSETIDLLDQYQIPHKLKKLIK